MMRLVLLLSCLVHGVCGVTVGLQWSPLGHQFFLEEPKVALQEKESSLSFEFLDVEELIGVESVSGENGASAKFGGPPVGPVFSFLREAWLEPKSIKRFSVSVERGSGEVLFGVGNGFDPVVSKHREWVVSSFGYWSVVGVADREFDIEREKVWGCTSRDGWTEQTREVEETIVTVDMRSKVPTVRFSTDTSSLVMTLDNFQPFSQPFERYDNSGTERPQQLLVKSRAFAFENARFGAQVPTEKALKLFMRSTDPSDACTPLINSGRHNVSHSIAFVMRGGCDFVDKVMNAQKAGAVAVVVGNQRRVGADEEELVAMDGGDREVQYSISIPAVFVAASTASFISSHLRTNSQGLMTSLQGSRFAPPSHGRPIVENGVYPVFWISPGAKVEVKLLEDSMPVAEESMENCRPVAYLPLSRKELYKYQYGTSSSKRIVRSVLACDEHLSEPYDSQLHPVVNSPKFSLPWPSDIANSLIQLPKVDNLQCTMAWVNIDNAGSANTCKKAAVIDATKATSLLLVNGSTSVECHYVYIMVQSSQQLLPQSIVSIMGGYGDASFRRRMHYYWEFELLPGTYNSQDEGSPTFEIGVSTQAYPKDKDNHNYWMISSNGEWSSTYGQGTIPWQQASPWSGKPFNASSGGKIGVLLDMVDGRVLFLLEPALPSHKTEVFVITLQSSMADTLPRKAWGYKGDGSPSQVPQLYNFVSSNALIPTFSWRCKDSVSICSKNEAVMMTQSKVNMMSFIQSLDKTCPTVATTDTGYIDCR